MICSREDLLLHGGQIRVASCTFFGDVFFFKKKRVTKKKLKNTIPVFLYEYIPNEKKKKKRNHFVVISRVFHLCSTRGGDKRIRHGGTNVFRIISCNILNPRIEIRRSKYDFMGIMKIYLKTLVHRLHFFY